MVNSARYPDYPFAYHAAHVPGGKLHYIDEGEGPVVVMLHGNPTWSFYFRHLITHLRRHCRVIAPDHIGCGLSDKPTRYEYNLRNHINNLQALLTQLAISRSALVMHDWGGAIGMGYAIRHLEQISALVVMNTAAFHASQIPLRIGICRWPVIGRLLVQGLNAFAAGATWMAVTKPLAKDTKAAYLQPYNTWQNRIGIYRFIQDIPLTKDHPSYKTLFEIDQGLKEIGRRAIPMQIIWGGRDFCFNDYFFDQWRSRFPGAAHHYFPDFGHYVLEDGHGVVEPLISGFIQKYGSNAKDEYCQNPR